jgi:ring-1,2-phenylacetyl-CoA epoxidase subunit PaaD
MAPAVSTRVDVVDVVRVLDEVPDPEIPTVSIVELGMIGEVEIGREELRVELLPTFVGCPALEVIEADVRERLVGLAPRVTVDVSFATPWTSDRISPVGRQKLRRSGFAPPPPLRPGRALPVVMPGGPATLPGHGDERVDAGVDAEVACPYCGSTRTTLESVFGPTQCRSIRHCPDCRQPFEAFKPV